MRVRFTGWTDAALPSGSSSAPLFRVRRFDVMIGGKCLADLSEEEVEILFKLGQADRQTQCRLVGTQTWQTIDEHLPLLKYVHRNASPTVPKFAPIIPASVQVTPDRPANEEPFRTDERGKPSLTSSLKAGWICFGVGAAVAWIFPPAFLFYSVALIMAIVAMCTHQVSRGLVLLLSSFVAMGTSAFLSFLLAVGMFAAAMKPVVEKAERDRERMEQAERQLEQQLQRTQDEFTRSMERSLSSLRSVQPPVIQSSPPQPQVTPKPPLPLTLTPPRLPSYPSARPASPVVGYPVDSLSRQDLMDEIKRVETKQRQLRRLGRDLDRLTSDYLTNLRAELDNRTGR